MRHCLDRRIPSPSRVDDESDFETRVIRHLVAQTQEAVRLYYRAVRRFRAAATVQKSYSTQRKKAPPYTRWRFSDLELLLAADQTLTAHGPLHGDEGHHRATRGEQDVDPQRQCEVLELFFL